MLPGHIETAESQTYAGIVGEEIAAIGQAYIDGLPTNLPTRPPAWMWAGDSLLRQAYSDVITGESDVTTALATAEAKFSQYRQCVIEQDAFEDEAAQLACFESMP